MFLSIVLKFLGFVLFLKYFHLKNIVLFHVNNFLVWRQPVFIGRARSSFMIRLHCFALCMVQRNASWRKGRRKALLSNLEFLYTLDYWWSKDVLTIYTLPGGKSLFSWLCSVDSQKGLQKIKLIILFSFFFIATARRILTLVKVQLWLSQFSVI